MRKNKNIFKEFEIKNFQYLSGISKKEVINYVY